MIIYTKKLIMVTKADYQNKKAMENEILRGYLIFISIAFMRIIFYSSIKWKIRIISGCCQILITEDQQQPVLYRLHFLRI